MNLAMLTKYAIVLLPLLVSSSPILSSKSSQLHRRSRAFPHSSHILPLKGIPRRRRHSWLVSRDDATALIDPASQRDFLVPVSLGGQTVDLIIDTGSSNTWALSEGYSCVSGTACDFGNAISVDSDFTIFESVSFYTNYADNSNATGVLAQSSVAFAGVEVPAQDIGLVDEIAFNGDGLMSGLIGLGFSSITSALQGNTPTTYTSIMDNIFSERLTDNPYFAIAISRDASKNGMGGYMSIGGVPDESDPQINVTSQYGSANMLLNPEFQLNSLSNYVISLDALSVYNPSSSDWVVDDTPFPYLVDSGTTISQVPDSDAEYINSLFQPPAIQGSNGYYMVQCDAIPPYISIRVGGVELPINPVDLLFVEGSSCYSGVQPLLMSPEVGIIGDTFMRSLLAVFDWGSEQVHLASRPLYES